MSKPKSGLFEGTKGTGGTLKAGASPSALTQKNVSPRGNHLIKNAKDEKLIATIKQLYRPGAIIGDGGTADAIRYEKRTGVLLSKSGHITKGQQRLQNLSNILKRNDLSKNDRKIAQELYDDLKNALEDK